MSGDWIKMRGNLWDDPRIAAICDDTDATEASVIGALYWLWASADQHTEDGTMPGLSLRQIDRKTGLVGFAAAVVKIGWLSEVDGGLKIPRFNDHNGSSAKRRGEDAKRKAASRSQKEDGDRARKFITQARKEQIFDADGRECVYCGRNELSPTPANEKASAYALSIDHVIPFSQGGDDSDSNLVTACLPCNMRKNGRTPEQCGMIPNLSARIRTGFGHDAELEKEIEREKEEEQKKAPAKRAVDYFPDVDPEIASAYAALRKRLRAPLSDIAVKGLRREAGKAGMTIEAVLTMCCERSWRGFSAEWVAGKANGATPHVHIPAGGGRKEL